MSTSDKRAKIKGRKSKAQFIMLLHTVYDSPNFTSLSAYARRALLDLARRYNGRNNGDLALTWKMAHKAGWKSRDTLEKSIAELVHFGMIVRTRQGGLNSPNLYALTWYAIDHCKGKLDVHDTKVPGNEWKVPKPAFDRSGKSEHQQKESKGLSRWPGGYNTTVDRTDMPSDPFSATGATSGERQFLSAQFR